MGFAQGMQIAFDIPFNAFLARTYAYSPAVQAAVAELMGLEAAAVWVVEVRPATAGGTIAQLDIASVTSSSETSAGGTTLPVEVATFGALFGSGNAFITMAGDAARPPLISALQKYGLPVTSAFYYDKPATPSRKLLAASCVSSPGISLPPLSLTLRLPYLTFSANAAALSVAVGAALTPLLSASGVVVMSATSAAASPNSTVLTFAPVYVTVDTAAGAETAAAAVSPAVLLAALRCAGVPALGATMGSPQPPPPPLGSFTGVAQGQQLALPIPFRTFQARMFAYVPAAESALAEVLELELESDVWVTDARRSAGGMTIVAFSITCPDDNSETSASGMLLPYHVVRYGELFGSGDGFTAAVGDAASPALVAALRRYGLPVDSAFYFDFGPGEGLPRRLLGRSLLGP